MGSHLTFKEIKNHIPPPYLYPYANIVFEPKLKGPIPSLLRKSWHFHQLHQIKIKALKS